MPLRCALAVLLLAASADAAEIRVAVLPFTGPRASVVREQIVTAVCEGDLHCAAEAFVRKGKPDWEKIRRQDVALIVTGRVTGEASARALEVEVFRADESSALRQTLALAADGKAAADAVQELDAKVLELVRPAAQPAPAHTAEATSGAPPGSTEGSPPREEDAALVEPLVPPPSPVEPPPAKPPPAVASSRFPLVAVEAGIDLVRRSFEYRDLETFTLREYETNPAIPTPRLRIEAHPFVSSPNEALAALQLEADLLAAIGLRTINPDNPDKNQTYATNFQRLDVGASWYVPLAAARRLRVGPAVGYRYALFDVGLSSAGEQLDGLADVRYLAVRGGFGAEYGLSRWRFFARGDYVHPLGYGGIKSYFPQVSGAAFELEAGAGFRFTPGFELDARLHYGRYAMSFRTEPTADYIAAGASDDYLGLALLMRYAFGAR
jgi:hypothetical protein